MKKTILFIGHSLIEFYDWQTRFQKYNVYKMGIAGETVDGLYLRLPYVFENIKKPDFIFIMSGINDLSIENRNFLDTYRKVIIAFKSHYPDARIVINSITPVLFPFISNKDICDMNKSLKDISKEENVMFLDLYSYLVDDSGEPQKRYLDEDGVHLSEEGYRIWISQIEKIL